MNAEKLKEITDRVKHERSYQGIGERYYNDILEYLSSKWPDLPKHEVQETAAYATNRMTIAMSDTIAETNRQWQAINRKMDCKEQIRKLRELNDERRKHENCRL